MRAILIDPNLKTIEEVQLEGEFLQAAYDSMNVSCVQIVSTPYPNHDMWVDEEGLFKPGLMSFVLKGGFPEPVFGRCLITCSTPSGDTMSASVSLTQVKKDIRWMPFITRGM